jgi:hypothetical protein
VTERLLRLQDPNLGFAVRQTPGLPMFILVALLCVNSYLIALSLHVASRDWLNQHRQYQKSLKCLACLCLSW